MGSQKQIILIGEFEGEFKSVPDLREDWKKRTAEGLLKKRDVGRRGDTSLGFGEWTATQRKESGEKAWGMAQNKKL